MDRNNNPVLLISIAFFAGFLSVLIFHQPMLIILKAISLAPEKLTPYAMAATAPFGVPRVFSLAFWGGIWGIALAIAIAWTGAKGLAYWLLGIIIGALGPSLVNWFIVLPLKGEPIGGGWAITGLLTALLVNAAWGFGSVVLFRLLGSNLLKSNQRSPTHTEGDEKKINR